MQIRRILVPIDFSPDADQAMAWAIDLARRYDASLVLTYVVQPVAWPASPDGLVVTPSDLLATARRELGMSLDRTRESIETAGIHAEAVLIDGSPAREIAELARAKGVDLIVMGTHGRTGIQHALLGSVAEKVLRTAPCPVLTVRMREATP
jgi:universal stress protein A